MNQITFRRCVFFAVCAFLLVLSNSFARAQGVIVPIICNRPPRCVPPPRPPRPIIVPNQLPIKSIRIDTKIKDQVATTHVEQIFRNDTDQTLEGTYFFPISENASISEFAIWENDKKLVGEVRTREEARRIYESIVRRQRDPGLLEYAGKDLFQATIFPILPRSDKKLEITYTEVLKNDGGTIAYRYPLGAGKQTVPIGTVSGKIEIESAAGLRNVYSPTHQIDTNRTNDSRAALTFESANKIEQQDFQLFYAESGEDVGMSLVTYREPGKDGYFLLMLQPKDQISERELASKDVVFVLDTSGSMADEGKMEKARKALLFGVQTLRDADRFNVINFAGEEHLMESGLIQANAAGRKRGDEFVKNLRPTGGTNINDALRAAIKQFGSGDRPKMLVFMTDGLPTVGETNAKKIVENARTARAGLENLRIFTFGVGYDVNTQLLDKVAAENGGASDYVEPKEDIELKVSSFFAKVASPVLTDVEINFGGANVDLVYPRQNPDLFRGAQLTLIGRYRDDVNNGVVTLRGRNDRENRTFTFQNVDFPNRAEANDFLPRLWATRRVGWLVEQIRSNGENKELRDEVTDLGTRYGIVTPYTSYLAVDGQEITNLTQRQIRDLPVNGRRPQARRSGVSKDKSAPSPRFEGLMSSGADAVRDSKQQNAQQANATVAADNELILVDDSNLQKIGAKTFYQENAFWQDSEFKPEAKLPEITLKFASEEYFELLKTEKDLAQYFALGEQVIVVYKGKIYRIVK